MQLVRGASRTADGFETTFQVNHLAQLALVDALLERPAPPRRVAFVGSATHDSAPPPGYRRRSGARSPSSYPTRATIEQRG
ncbi:MAG: hypothetical protein M3P95_07395 [Actinomycetota bacterium]|nr:hypothetical protein [Actinomycetota bacterium]